MNTRIKPWYEWRKFDDEKPPMNIMVHTWRGPLKFQVDCDSVYNEFWNGHPPGCCPWSLDGKLSESRKVTHWMPFPPGPETSSDSYSRKFANSFWSGLEAISSGAWAPIIEILTEDELLEIRSWHIHPPSLTSLRDVEIAVLRKITERIKALSTLC